MLVIFVAMFTCAMTAPLVPMPEEAKSNASTTKLQLVEGKSKGGCTGMYEQKQEGKRYCTYDGDDGAIVCTDDECCHQHKAGNCGEPETQSHNVSGGGDNAFCGSIKQYCEGMNAHDVGVSTGCFDSLVASLPNPELSETKDICGACYPRVTSNANVCTACKAAILAGIATSCDGFTKFTGQNCVGSEDDLLRGWVGTADQCKTKCSELNCPGFIRVTSKTLAGQCFFRGGTLSQSTVSSKNGDRDCYVPQGTTTTQTTTTTTTTEEPTEAPTEPPTEAPTEPPTEAPTEPPTEAPTEPPTEAPTEPPTEAPTEPPTEAPTEAAQKTDECLAKSYACANYGTCCGNNNYRKHGHKLICREAKKMRPCSSGTTCSAGEIPTAELCPPAADLTEEEKKIKEQCEAEIADIVAQKVIHDARVKAVEEFQESVDGDFCGKDEIKEWLESLDDKAKRNEEKITKGCEIETKMITTPLSDVITTLDCEGTTSDCIPAEEVTKIVEEAETLTEENQKLVEECEKTVTNLKTEKPIHTEEITALEEFETHVGDDWCGKTILEEFIDEKKGKWTPSQDKIDEDCQTINKESETLQEIQKILTNSVVDE